ncbi:hypothetical protein WJN01_10090 [Flavobacteriaceae bacterium SZ-1-7]|uniref:hypothetical protein n=1 Tax=Tamlana sedimenti TaxID=3134126 RepID=UPI0031207E9B
MILTITLVLSTLIAINFLLLKFSCNKTNRKSEITKRPVILKLEDRSIVLAPTGS